MIWVKKTLHPSISCIKRGSAPSGGLGTSKHSQYRWRGYRLRYIKRSLQSVCRSDEGTKNGKAHGDHFEAWVLKTRESVRICTGGCTHPSGRLVTRHSEALQQLVPVGANYGYDLEVFIGLERFVHHRQREEIRRALQVEHGILLSSGEVSVLAKRFLSHLEALHLAHTESIRAAFIKDGGYPLHIDATGEDGRGTLFVAYSGWRQWVLGAWKLLASIPVYLKYNQRASGLKTVTQI